ncbi:unnamed protein product [Diamesa serratosioi]
MESSSKLYGSGGRFSEQMNVTLAQLNNSLAVDKRLYAEDIRGSVAYAEILSEINLLTKSEFDQIKSAFNIILREWKNDEIVLKVDDEDVHSVNERRLIEIIGDVGRKLHTGRSRNEQVVVDMKLWMKDAIKKLLEVLSTLLETFVIQSEKHIDVIMPGYTHLQRAQPVRFSHWLLAHGFFLNSDCDRLIQLFERVNVLPLGSGAIAGSPFNINRKRLAELLGFKEISNNSMNVVADRDFVVEFNFICTLISTHLSRLSEDCILFSTKEFSFIKISSEYATGSSLMPQKYNADSLEIVRGTTGSIFGQLANILMTLKGLPSTYNKDLQVDKQSMFLVFDNIMLSMNVIRGVIQTMTVNEDNCLKALSYDMLATDLAYYLVRKEVPFRDAHHCASLVVDYATNNNTEVDKVPLEALKDISIHFTDDVTECWSFEKSVEQYKCQGGTSRKSVQIQIAEIRNTVDLLRRFYNKA